jgi:PAS domain S-box-containing protein
MTWFPPKPLNPADWRRQAEEQLEAEGFEDLEGVDAKRVLHELRVHQLELEMQNEALGEARLEAEAGWERFQDLYDSAPAAYFSLDRWGDILEVNLAGTRLLGVDRAALVNRRFASFLRGADLAVFTAFLQKGLENQDNPPCEVAVEANRSVPIWVCLQGAGSADGKVLPLAALDITRQRLTQERLERLDRELEGRAGFRTAQLEGLCRDLEAIRQVVDNTLERTRLALDQGPPGI